MVNNFTSPPVTGAPPVPDPYSSLGSSDATLQSIHAAAPTCSAANTNLSVSPSSTKTINPGIYCGDWKIQGTVTLNPGVYYIYQGNLSVNSGAVMTGSGVTIIMTTLDSQPAKVGSVSINGGSTITLTPPSLSTTVTPDSYYKGVVFFYDSKNLTTNPTLTFNGGSGMSITGSMYVPTATVDFLGNNGVSAPTCTKIIAYDIQFTGNQNSSLDTSGCASVLGTTGDTTVYQVVLTQ
jgi:hypothetical protein